MKNRIIIIILALTLMNTLFLFYNFVAGSNTPNVAVVQMEKLVYEYKGMQEATNLYSAKLSSWNAQADSLKRKMEILFDEIKSDSLAGKNNVLLAKKKKFNQYRATYFDYQNNLKEVASKEDQEMTLGVINQIREHMKSYAQEEGYDLIIANTELENIAYASEPLDVTSSLLEYANYRYEYGE